jgi:hypothetical protein
MAKQYPILPAPPHYTPVVETNNDDGIVIDVIGDEDETTRVTPILVTSAHEEPTVVSDATKVYAFEVETLLNCGHLSLDQVVDIIKRSPPKVHTSR